MPKDPWHPQCDDGYKSNLEFDQTPQEVHLKGQAKWRTYSKTCTNSFW